MVARGGTRRVPPAGDAYISVRKWKDLMSMSMSMSMSISGLPSFLDRTEHLNENRLCCQHLSEPFDQGL